MIAESVVRLSFAGHGLGCQQACRIGQRNLGRLPGCLLSSLARASRLSGERHRDAFDAVLMARYNGFHQHMLVADGRAIQFYRKCGFERAGKTEPMWIYAGHDH